MLRAADRAAKRARRTAATRQITDGQLEHLRSLGWDNDDIQGMTCEQAIEAIQRNRVPLHAAQ